MAELTIPLVRRERGLLLLLLLFLLLVLVLR